MTRYAEKEELVPVWRGVYQRRLVSTGKSMSQKFVGIGKAWKK